MNKSWFDNHDLVFPFRFRFHIQNTSFLFSLFSSASASITCHLAIPPVATQLLPQCRQAEAERKIARFL
jgi:hypothetical protein